jgi:hypothetical protein
MVEFLNKNQEEKARIWPVDPYRIPGYSNLFAFLIY